MRILTSEAESRQVHYFEHAKPQVENILKVDSLSRNSNQALLWEFFKLSNLMVKKLTSDDELVIITKSQWMKLTPVESVTRARRAIQEEARRIVNESNDTELIKKYAVFLADPKVEEARDMEQDAMRHHFHEEKRGGFYND